MKKQLLEKNTKKCLEQLLCGCTLQQVSTYMAPIYLMASGEGLRNTIGHILLYKRNYV